MVINKKTICNVKYFFYLFKIRQERNTRSGQAEIFTIADDAF